MSAEPNATPSGGMRRQFLGILVSRGLGSALQAVALVVLARNVSAAEFGIVNVVIAVVGIVLVASGLGLSLFVPFAHARREPDAVVAALRLNSGANLVAALVLVPAIALWAGASGAPWGAALIGASLALERNVDTILGLPIAEGDARVAATSMLVRRSVCLAVFLPALALGGEPVWSFTAGLLAGALAAQVHARRSVRRPSGVVGAVRAREVLARAWPFLVSNLSGQARTLDVTVVAAVLSAGSAGLYAAATKLVQPLLLVPQSLAAVVMPRSTGLEPAVARRLGLRLTLLFLACLVPAVPLVIWAEDVVVLVMGPGYAGAGPALGWAVAGLPFLAMSASLGAVLQGQGRERFVAINGVVFAIAMFPAIVVGALVGGIGGAAAGLGASFAARAVSLCAALVRGPSSRSAPPHG
ncbi:MAG: oligosaccharide flippase family protein [Actinomycetota bacterium]|nr:oligosaccharide flippase family protein [Actinomycetota bacterium]